MRVVTSNITSLVDIIIIDDYSTSSSHDLIEEDDDVEVTRLSRQLDGWYHELKSNVLVSL